VGTKVLRAEPCACSEAAVVALASSRRIAAALKPQNNAHQPRRWMEIADRMVFPFNVRIQCVIPLL
jgi:glycogen debranching enzyme